MLCLFGGIAFVLHTPTKVVCTGNMQLQTSLSVLITIVFLMILVEFFRQLVVGYAMYLSIYLAILFWMIIFIWNSALKKVYIWKVKKMCTYIPAGFETPFSNSQYEILTECGLWA